MQSQPLTHGPKGALTMVMFTARTHICAYCKDLRVAEERWKRAQKEEQRAQSV